MRKLIWFVIVPAVTIALFILASLIGGLSQIFGRVDRWELQMDLSLALMWVSLGPTIVLFALGYLPIWKKRPKVSFVLLEAASVFLSFFFGTLGAAVQARQSVLWYAIFSALALGWLGWYEKEGARPWRRRLRSAAVAVLAWLIICAAAS